MKSGVRRLEDGDYAVNSPPYYMIKLEGVMYAPQYFDAEFRAHYASVKDVAVASLDALWNVFNMAKQCRSVPGDYFECGVNRGGSALLTARVLEGSNKVLHLFDTFSGMPETDPEHDMHLTGNFSDCSFDMVKTYIGHEESVVFHRGLIPQTFRGMEDVAIAFAYVDVDIYRSTLDCLEFIYPRLSKGGVMILDDYLRPTCPGAREAVDEYLEDKKEIPLPLTAFQGMVFKL